MKIKKLFIITSLFVLSMVFFTLKSRATTYIHTSSICPSNPVTLNNINCPTDSLVFYSYINLVSSTDSKTITINTKYTGVGGNGGNQANQGYQGGNQGIRCEIIDNAPREYALFGSTSTIIGSNSIIINQNNPGNSFYDNLPNFFASTTGIVSQSSRDTSASFTIFKMFRSPFEWRLNGKTMTSNGTYYIANVFKCPNDYNGNQFNGLMNSPFLVYLPIEIGTLGTSTPTITPSIDLNTR